MAFHACAHTISRTAWSDVMMGQRDRCRACRSSKGEQDGDVVDDHCGDPSSGGRYSTPGGPTRRRVEGAVRRIFSETPAYLDIGDPAFGVDAGERPGEDASPRSPATTVSTR